MIAVSSQQAETAFSDRNMVSSGRLTVDTVLQVRSTSQLIGNWNKVRESEQFISAHMEEMAGQGGPLWKLPVVYVEVSGALPASPFLRVLRKTLAELESQGHTAVNLKSLPDRLIKVALQDNSSTRSREVSLDSGVDLFETPILDRRASLSVLSHTARRLFPDVSDCDSSDSEDANDEEPSGAWRLLGVCSEGETSGTAVVAVRDELWLMHLHISRLSDEQDALDFVDLVESKQTSNVFPPLLRGFSSAGWAADFRGRVYAVGGYDRGGFLHCVKTCALGDNNWQNLQPHLQHARARAGAGLVDGTLYAVGGSDGRQELASAEKLLLEDDGDWCRIAPMHNARSGVAVSVLSDHLCAVGGTSDGILSLSSAELYEPKSDTWKLIAQLAEPRSEAAAATLDGTVYAAGGSCGLRGYLKSVECYDLISDSWSAVSPLSISCRGAAMVTHQGALFAAGGYNGSRALSDVQMFDPRSGCWQKMSNLLHARSGSGLVSVGDLLFAIGGYSSTSFINSVEVYDSRMNEWNALHTLSSLSS